ncbi:hypothetical protein [Sphingorhabdus sp.]
MAQFSVKIIRLNGAVLDENQQLAGQEFDFPAARLSLKAHEARVLLRG